MISVVRTFILWAHLFSAMLFIGGSFFMWLILVPASKEVEKDEAKRTMLVAKVSKRFAKLTSWLLAALIVSGLLNAAWYTPSYPYQEYLVLGMAAATLALVVLLYGPGRYYGRQIADLAKKRDIRGLEEVRRKSTIVSYMNLVLMVLISIIAVLL